MDEATKLRICEELGGLTPDIYDELVKDFIGQASEQFVTMKDALAKDDWDVAGRTAHSIKGSSANLRIQNLSDIAKVLEMNAKNEKDKASYTEKLEELEKAFTEFRESF